MNRRHHRVRRGGGHREHRDQRSRLHSEGLRRHFRGRGFRAAFTLVEVAAVLVLTALLATAVGVSMHARQHRTTLDDVIGRLVQADRLTREHARRFGRPAQLVFDLERQEVLRLESDSQKPQAPPLVLPQLPGGVELREVIVTVAIGREGEGDATRITYGQASLACSSRGHTPSYSLRLVQRNGEERWLTVAGLTGQATTHDEATSDGNL